MILNKMIKIITLFWIIQCELTKSAKVVFDLDSKEILRKDFTKYCKHPYCPVGSHVLCLDPVNYPHTRKCEKLQEIVLTKEYIELILQHVNRFRSEAARGLANGYNSINLPRAYGMIKLQWDPTLAHYAQVWANNCPTTHDHCRATQKFSDPGQLVMEALLKGKQDEEALEPKYIDDIIEQTTDYIFHDRKFVDATMIKRTPNWIRIMAGKKTINDIYYGGQYYTNMVHSNATHIGCGLSVALTSEREQSTFEPIYKAYLVCNLSHQPKLGYPVYAYVKPRKQPERPRQPTKTKKKEPIIIKKICTSKANCVALDFPEEKNEEVVPQDNPQKDECGCPHGYKETEDCLCEQPIANPELAVTDDEIHELATTTGGYNKDPYENQFKSNQNHLLPVDEKKDKEDEDCNPAELVLPIFAEDDTKIRRQDLEDYFIANQDDKDYITTKLQNLNKPVPEYNEDWESKMKKQFKENNNRQSLFEKALMFHKFNSKPDKTNDVQKNFEPEIKVDHENVHADEPIYSFESKPEEKNDAQKNYFNNKNVYDDLLLHNFDSKPDKKDDVQSKYETEINIKTENVHNDALMEDTKPENIEEKINSKEESPSKNEDTLIDWLDNIEKAIQNTPLGNAKKEIIHSKIKKIFSMVGLPEDSNVLQYSNTMQKVKNRNAQITDRLSEPEEVINEDHIISERRHHKPPRNEHTLRTFDQRRTKPSDLKTIRNRLKYKDNVPKSYKNYEFYSHEEVKPKLHNKNQIRQDLEALMKIVESKYQNSEPEFSRPVDEYPYNNDEIDFEKDKEYRSRQGRYKGEINSDYSFEDKLKGFTSNDEKMLDEHVKYDTESTYGEDSSDEWIHFYNEKHNNIKHRKPYRTAHFHDEFQHRPVHIQRRLKDLGLSLGRSRSEHYYEPDHARFQQEYDY